MARLKNADNVAAEDDYTVVVLIVTTVAPGSESAHEVEEWDE